MKAFQYVGNNLIFSVWCETCRYQCLENLLVGLAAAAAPLGPKWPWWSYWIVLARSAGSCYPILVPKFPVFHGLINQVPPLDFVLNGSSDVAPIRLQVYSYFCWSSCTLSHIFHCQLSFPTPNIFHRIWAVNYMSKIFQFADCGQSFQTVIGHNSVSHWCIHPSHSPRYRQSFFYLLSFAPKQHCWKDCCLQ